MKLPIARYVDELAATIGLELARKRSVRSRRSRADARV
jgi:hypothetical protein